VTAGDYAGIASAVLALLTAIGAGLRWVVKSYLAELKPNSGGSLSDRVSRVEARVDDIYRLLVERR